MKTDRYVSNRFDGLRLWPAAASALCAAALITGCSGGGGGGGTIGTSGDFVVLRTEPANNGRIFLNEPLRIDFSNPVDVKSVDFNAVAFQVFDLNGKARAEPVAGKFRLQKSSDGRDNHRLEFVPRFPLSDTYDDGGFKPGRIYQVQLVEGNPRTKVGLRDINEKGLRAPVTFQFTTADGTTPSQLFRDTKVGGPRRTGLAVSPQIKSEVTLNELGQQQVEIRLTFDQPLNPSSANVPFRLDIDPSVRDRSKRGRIYLEYDDRGGKDRWIPAEVELESNSLEGAIVVLRPAGILPNDATVRVMVESTLEDMSGESNVADAAYNRVFGTFRTRDDYTLRFDAVVEDFLNLANVNLSAPFLEPLAQVLPGAVRANFDFEGRDTSLRYEPNTKEVILNTDFTQISPKGAPKINVSGGVFEFRSVKIPANVTVRGVGSKPMVWLVLEDFIVEGKLLVEGGIGQDVHTLNAANFPTAGGIGACGGGNGGEGSPAVKARSLRGQSGFGPGQIPNGGGEGGRIYCSGTCGIGSGGGAGAFATQGDPYFKSKSGSNNSFVQQKGQGGFGCTGGSGSRRGTLAGGLSGPVAFTDPRVDNNFWGSAVDVNRQIRISGELLSPKGGAGGGGGGDWARSCTTNDANFINDEKGGGGGAGGGILIVKALGRIIVGREGIISCNGGNGGGGAWAAANNRGGGGGAGAGGMLVLMAGKSIDLVVHGTVGALMPTYGNGNYDFVISADGGLGITGGFSANILKKYPPAAGSSIDAKPAGGMGGLGIIQLMAPPGVVGTSGDGTNTVLDDNINFFNGSINGNKITGANKRILLGWRGMPNNAGTFVDDAGKTVGLKDAEGDMRPSPILMPAPFGSRSRMRSKWIDLGAAVRRLTNSGGDGLGRGVFVPNMKTGSDFGPQPFFAGTFTNLKTDPRYGFIDFSSDTAGNVTPVFTKVAEGSIASTNSDALFRSQKVYEVKLTASVLGAVENRYSHYTAQLMQGATVVQEHRILGHGANNLYLDTKPGTLPSGVTKVVVVAKFFSVFTGQTEGFPQTYASGPGKFAPKANVQIGFAWHEDPSDPNAKRYPTKDGEFEYNMNSAGVIETIRSGHYRYVQWDLLFDTIFQATTNSAYQNEDSLGPQTPLPEMRKLIVPFWY